MKIFVFGANGMLGTYVTHYLSKYYEIVPLTRKDYDLANVNFNSLYTFLLSKDIEKNDIIINCAGIIPQTGNSNKKSFYIVNTVFPLLLNNICNIYKVKNIHVTTDCVFSGKHGWYDELSEADEVSDYGVSKHLGEKSNATIIRTSIIGEELNNKRSLLEWVRSNKNSVINGYVNHYWNGVTCLQLAKIIHEMISENKYWNGVRHIFSPDYVSKYDLVSMINKIYDLNIIINKFVTEETIDKTLCSVYNLEFNIPSLKQQIEEMCQYTL